MLNEVKEILYEIITYSEGTEEEDQPSIKAVQNMGVSITKAIAEKGINVIQLQNVVQNNVIKLAVKALKYLDAYEDKFPILPMERVEPIQIESKSEEVIDIEPDQAFKNFIRADINDEIPTEIFIRRVLKLYVTYAMERYGSEEVAAKKVRMPYDTFVELLDEAKSIS